MKTKFPLLTWLFTRHKANSFKIPTGGCAIVLDDKQTLSDLIDGLADADTYTGLNYSGIIFHSKIITNYETT